MTRSPRQLTHPVRMAALAVAVITSLFLCLDAPRAQMPNAGDRPLAIPRDGRPLDHEPVSDPASLDDAAAERIYRAIRRQMQAGYAGSGDPIAWAYTMWQRHNQVPYRSHQHGQVYVNNYANAAAAAYGDFAAGQPLPAGAIIAKDSFIVTGTGEIRAGPLTIMEKMPAGFDPGNGDWRYLVIDADGAMIGLSASGGLDATMTQCAACHAGAPQGQDFLFYVPAEARR